MPYISKRQREILDNKQDEPCAAGELNYAITKLIQQYLPKPPRYDNYNEVLGVLEAVKLELYRRMVAPYEDTKIAENGDVY